MKERQANAASKLLSTSSNTSQAGALRVLLLVLHLDAEAPILGGGTAWTGLKLHPRISGPQSLWLAVVKVYTTPKLLIRTA